MLKHLLRDSNGLDEEALAWREVILAKKDPPLIFSQANTFLEEGSVILKEYEATARGVVQSWAERNV